MYLRCIVSTLCEHTITIYQKIYAADVYKLCLFNLYINMSASIHPVGILISLRQPFYLSISLSTSICKVLSFYTSTYILHTYFFMSLCLFLLKLLHPKNLNITYLYNLSTFLSICLSNYLSIRICIFIAGYPEA